jgi:hypothetical protein
MRGVPRRGRAGSSAPRSRMSKLYSPHSWASCSAFFCFAQGTGLLTWPHNAAMTRLRRRHRSRRCRPCLVRMAVGACARTATFQGSLNWIVRAILRSPPVTSAGFFFKALSSVSFRPRTSDSDRRLHADSQRPKAATKCGASRRGNSGTSQDR